MNARKIAAMVVLALVALFGAVAVPTSSVAGQSHVRACVTGKGWKVPARALALCDSVAQHAGFWDRQHANWTPNGAIVVRGCRVDAANEAKQWGRKDGDRYVIDCLRGAEEFWYAQQPKK